MPESLPPFQLSSPKVVYQDDWLIAIDKPPGLPSVPTKTPVYPHNAWQLMQRDWQPLYVVHRLDINTSGLLLLARTRRAQSAFNQLFATRQITKHYRALLNGSISFDFAEVDLPIASDWPNRPLQKIHWQNGRPAKTRIRKVHSTAEVSEVELMPQTGRSHQLRIHCAMLGYPIVGCQLYATKQAHVYGQFEKPNRPSNCRLMLHAEQLSFRHPMNGRETRITAYADFKGQYGTAPNTEYEAPAT